MSQVITPTVGRKVWYRPSAADKSGNFGMRVSGEQPLDATVTAVWGDRMINVVVFDIMGRQFPLTSIRLHQDGDKHPRDANNEIVGGYAEWMPYQIGQAKKAESEESTRV